MLCPLFSACSVYLCEGVLRFPSRIVELVLFHSYFVKVCPICILELYPFLGVYKCKLRIKD